MPTNYLPPSYKLNLPQKAWGTKGFEFWSFLSLLLVAAKPKKILELGSGRSTITFSEFAHQSACDFVSVEMDEAWVNKAALELFYLGIGEKYVHHVPLEPTLNWFRLDLFRAATRRYAPFDFALIDAPNGYSGNSHGYRDNDTGITEIKCCTNNSQVIIVDDTHRRHIFDTIDPLLEAPSNYIRYYYDYDIEPSFKNSLCIAVREESKLNDAVDRIREILPIRLYQAFDPANCPKD